MVDFLNLQASYVEIKEEIDCAVHRVLDSGRSILGAEVEIFEEAFAEYCGAKYCVTVASGLSALHLSLLAMEVGPGDEVIVPSNTFIATWLAVSQTGATPVAVEPDPLTHNIDCDRIESVITTKTKAIVPVNLYGQPANLQRVADIADKHGIRVLQDAAQSHGARYQGKPIGVFGDAAAWSFYPGKNLGAMGDGGAVTTSDPGIASHLRLLRNYGSKKRYFNEIRGFNSRLDPLQAAILGVKLKYLNAWNGRRAKVAASYSKAFANSPAIICPVIRDDVNSAWHLYVLRTPHRDALQEYLAGKGVETSIHYPIPPHLQPAYKELKMEKGSLPIAEQLANEVLSLPVGPELTPQDVQQVIDSLRAWFDMVQ